MTTASAGALLPPEVLYLIIGLAFSEHLDALIAGDHKLKHVPPASSSSEEQAGSGDSVHSSAAHAGGASRERLSTVAALLQTTFHIRQVTLKVLADALGLEMDEAGIGRLARDPWAHIQPVRVAYAAATASTSAVLALPAGAYARTSLLAPYAKMAALEQQWQRVLSHLGELRKQEDDCTAFETSVDRLVEQMEDALDLPATVPFRVLREPMCRRLGGLLILRNHHLSFTTFVKVVELQLLDMNTPDAEPCDFADFLEALQDLRTSQSDLEESQTEWTELYGPPLDDHKMDIDGMIPILDQLINLSVEDSNEAYPKCRELACNVRERLVRVKAETVPVAETGSSEEATISQG